MTIWVLVSAVAVLASGCVAPTGGNTAGVSGDKIIVGSLASLTGPVSADFAPITYGVESYLNMVNAEGGVNGRKIVLAYQLDDASNPTQDEDQVRTLVESDNVFALLGVATPTFSGGSWLAQHKIPTFGFDINPQWALGETMFGQNGSYLNFNQPLPYPGYLAQQLHVATAAVLAYNYPQSQQGCQQVIAGFKVFKIKVGYQDLSIPAPAYNLSANVARMQRDGVQMVVSCMDITGNILLSRSLKQAGMGNVHQLWLDGYDQSDLNQYSSLMDGVYFLTYFVPFSAGVTDPQRYPGMAKFLAVSHKYFPNVLPSEVELAGWLNAELFVKALAAIGRNVSRTRLVNAINHMTNWTGGGIVPPVDWPYDGHSAAGKWQCNVILQAQGDRFVPRFGTKPSVFSCFNYPLRTNTVPYTIPLPSGVPGA